VTIGENSVIGAGSTVLRDVPGHVIAYGSPCRVVRDNV
jgi:acetyltransferase-like isoleucine patch superfamily enzyme